MEEAMKNTARELTLSRYVIFAKNVSFRDFAVKNWPATSHHLTRYELEARFSSQGWVGQEQHRAKPGPSGQGVKFLIRMFKDVHLD